MKHPIIPIENSRSHTAAVFFLCKILIYRAKIFSLSSKFIGGIVVSLKTFFDMQPTVMTDFCSVGANDPA